TYCQGEKPQGCARMQKRSPLRSLCLRFFGGGVWESNPTNRNFRPGPTDLKSIRPSCLLLSTLQRFIRSARFYCILLPHRLHAAIRVNHAYAERKTEPGGS